MSPHDTPIEILDIDRILDTDEILDDVPEQPPLETPIDETLDDALKPLEYSLYHSFAYRLEQLIRAERSDQKLHNRSNQDMLKRILQELKRILQELPEHGVEELRRVGQVLRRAARATPVAGDPSLQEIIENFVNGDVMIDLWEVLKSNLDELAQDCVYGLFDGSNVNPLDVLVTEFINKCPQRSAEELTSAFQTYVAELSWQELRPSLHELERSLLVLLGRSLQD